MTELVIRALFLLVSGALGYQFTQQMGYGILTEPPVSPFWGIIIGVSFAVGIILLEMVFRKRPVQSVSAIIFGIIAGFILATLLGSVSRLLVTPERAQDWGVSGPDELAGMVQICLTVVCCYICILLIYRTRDQFRFIIPYVEFKKEEKGSRPVVVDTSAIIDGRLGEIVETNIFDSAMIVPKFVLQELQHVADSPDKLRRTRGRRGLEMLHRLQRDDRIEVQIHDGRIAKGSTVDSKLVSLGAQLQCRILTCDYNLGKIAELQGVDIVNLNDVATALRPIALPGEELTVKVVRAGDEAGQGVGYLSDGTMVVLENTRDRIGQSTTFVVTSTLQTSAGRMVFGRPRDQSEDPTTLVPPSGRNGPENG